MPGKTSFDYSSSNKRWQALRKRVLIRDKFFCREAKRYGKRVEATHVHHVWPAEDFPEYAYCEWNCLSLSGEAHDKMHDRKTRKLTALGEYWRRKTSPPTPSPSTLGELTAGRGTSRTHGGNFLGEKNS